MSFLPDEQEESILIFSLNKAPFSPEHEEEPMFVFFNIASCIFIQVNLDSQTIFDILSLGVGGVVAYHVLKTIFKSGHTLLYIPAILFVPVVFYVIYLKLLKNSVNEVPYTYIVGAAVVSVVFYVLLQEANKQVQSGKGGANKWIINVCGILSLILILTNIYPVADVDLGKAISDIFTQFLSWLRGIGSST